MRKYLAIIIASLALFTGQAHAQRCLPKMQGLSLIHIFGAASSSLLVWQTFALNARYGEHGLMKLGAARSHPRYLINRRRITRLFKRQRKEERQ